MINDEKMDVNSFLDAYNRFSISKKTGALGEYEFSRLVSFSCKLYANVVANSEINKDDQVSFESHLTQFKKDNINKDKYYAFQHKGLDDAVEKGLDKIKNASMSLTRSYEKAFRM